MAKTLKSKHRSTCPLNIALERVGDRWSLLILRDLMVMRARTFKDLMACTEKIASNVLASRLKQLISDGMIVARPDPADARKLNYALTEKGMDLATVIAELVLWAAKHEQTGNQALISALRADKQAFITRLRSAWIHRAENQQRQKAP